MNDKYILKHLKNFKNISASEDLREKILLESNNLPLRQKMFYFPLMSIRIALAVLVILILIGTGTGIVASINNGTPLAVVKTAVEKLPLPILKTKISPKLAPTNTPTPVEEHSFSSSTKSAEEKSENIQYKPNFWQWIFEKHDAKNENKKERENNSVDNKKQENSQN